MIRSFRLTNQAGDFVDIDDLNYPLHELQTEIDVRFPEKEKSQQHGIWNGYQYLGKRLWHLNGSILADTSAEYIGKRMKLLKVLMPHPHLNYKIVGTATIGWEGISEDLTQEFLLDSWPEIPIDDKHPTVSEFQVNLKCPDPRCYGVERSVYTVAPPLSIIGRNYDKTFPKTYPGGTQQPADILVENAGNIETFPRFRISGGYVENPRLTLIRYDGVQMVVALEGLILQTTDFVDLDFRKRTAILNNNLDVYDYTTLLSQWWALEPTVNGVQNVIRYSGTNIMAGSQAQVFWRNAYML